MYTKDELAKRRSTLSPEQQALLSKRLQRKIEQKAPVVTIPHRLPGSTVPLSFAQQRLWFLQQFDPESAAYNEMISLHLRNELNYEGLNQTITTIVQRHEVMRTIFPLTDEGPIQRIQPIETLHIKVPISDLQALPYSEREDAARQWVEMEMQRSFRLTKQFPWRIHLLQLEPDVHILVITMHHIVTDAWSLELFVKELVVLYQAYCHGSPSSLPDLPIQYADYACWQRQWLESKSLDGQISYWQRQLASPLPILELPSDRPRPGILMHHGRRYNWSMPGQLYQAANQLSQQEGATLFMLLLAAFDVLLYRYTLQEDVIVGSPVAGRIQFELEPLLGCFVNTLVFRTSLAGKPSFRELLQRVRQVALAAYEHQDVPFEKLVEILQPERSTGRNPIFQSMFVLQNVPLAQSQPSGLIVTPFEFEVKTTRFDLSIVLQENSHALSGYVEYNTELFNADTIGRLVGHYQRLLEGIIEHPDASIMELPLLSHAEWEQTVFAWNTVQHTDLETSSVCQLIDAQVERTPDAVAVCDEHEQLSYRELNARANRLAAHLQQRGVLPEQIIGLYCQRSVLWAISVLAIFKAGGVYLPLEPQHPPARLRAMLEQSQCHLLLCGQNLASQLISALHIPIQVLYQEQLLTTEPSGAFRPDDNNHSDAQLAYVIFTSGSTGLPKGVMVEQRGMRNHLLAKVTALNLCKLDIIAQTASQCFDISIWQLLAPWLVGSQARIYPEWLVADPKTMLQRLQRDHVSILEGVPSWLHALLDMQAGDIEQAELKQLRWVIPTGEALPTELCKRWLQRYTSTPLLNAYGPTECSDDVTHQEIYSLEDLELWGVLAPIGKPVPNLCVYVLDTEQQPQPIGIWGEIYIGGVGVGRGYISNVQRTAETFVPDPWSEKPGGRLYRTGDIGRYRADGSIEFQGRRDQQIKLRGYRIELGEIEAALSLHPSISGCVVLLREDSTEHKRLVAYITLAPEKYASQKELRGFLRKHLPDYMLPSIFIYLEVFPLLINGKIDRCTLPEPDTSHSLLETEFVAAIDPITEILVGIWSRLLNIEQISIHDNFFSLGGHSLLIPQLAMAIQSGFGIGLLPWATFFSSSTIAELAKTIKQALQGNRLEKTPQLVPVSRERDLPLSFTQERQWFLDQLNPEQHLYTVFGGIRLSGSLQVHALEHSLQEIVRRHEILRTTFVVKEDGTLKQVIAPKLTHLLPIINMHELSETEQELAILHLVEQEKHRIFDLAHGPLLRTTILHLAEEEYVLLLTSHAIILDGWATEVLLREIARLYTACAENTPSPLSDLPFQYADYACWQRELLTNETLEHLQQYWSKQLADIPTLTLPTDRPRPAFPTFRAATLPLHVPAPLTEKLKALSQREGATLYMTLLAAYQAILARYSGQDDIVVGSPIANRNASELEGLIGNFINTLLLRTDMSGNPTFRELLSRVRSVALGAYAHQDLPFEKLLAELHPERDMSRNPLFQALFAFQNNPRLRVALPGLTTDFLANSAETTVFDLDLTLWESKNGLSGVLKYSTDIFDIPLVERIKTDLMALLELMAADPEQRISDLSLFAEAEYLQLLNERNQTRTDYALDLCLHQRVEIQTEQTPDAIAVVFQNEQVTYQELNNRANQLAHHLQKLDAGTESLVGICMERSVEMVIALLATLKSGAAYVPLDPTYPAERLAFLLQDAGISVLLTQEHLLTVLPQHSTHVLCNDTAIGQESRTNPLCKTLPGNVAYLIYTSGSTGKPKGVMISHEGICNRLLWMQEAYHLTGTDRVLQKTSFSFDVSVWEFFWPLLVGARLIMAEPEGHKDSAYLVKLIAEQQITVLHFVPSMLHIFLDESRLETCSSLRKVICSGEILPFEFQERFFARFAAELHNLYGPTEASIDVTFWACERESTRQIVPIGRPIANTQIYLLDRYLHPVPEGVPGELYIGSIGLARGYLNRRDLTAEYFIPNPLSQVPGERLYKTGDLARYLPDGSLEFIGRVDHQVKIRGMRIELGEIEATLARHQELQVAIVEAQRDSSGEKRLIAYVVPERGSTPTPIELRSYLLGFLPEYMVPAAFVLLESLPVTANGKIDRHALPKPLIPEAKLREDYVAPRTLLEEQLAAIWSELLGVERVSIYDDFFTSGGHSLLTIRLVMLIEQLLGKRLPLAAIFQGRTIKAIAEMLSNTSEFSPWSMSTETQPIDLQAEATLELDISPEMWPAELPTAPANVLLTGANGFLGTFLLAELLQRTSANIYCLVRASDVRQGKDKIQQALSNVSLWQPEFHSRIRPLPGDLTQPRFGLSEQTFDNLARELDTLYHNGAIVDVFAPYQQMKAANVDGTREIIRLATTHHIKPLHYISTLSVFSHKGLTPIQHVSEQEALDRVS